MATTQEGGIDTTAVSTSQDNKVAQINETDLKAEKAAAFTLELDLGTLTGTQNQSLNRSECGRINCFGSTTGAVTVGLNTSIRKSWWIRNETTNGDVITVQPTGGVNPVTLPLGEWVQILSEEGGDIVLAQGWADPADATAIVFNTGANWAEFTGRELTMRKQNAEPGSAGGFVTLTGAVEKTTGTPIASELMITLPVNYRPANSIVFVVGAEVETAGAAGIILVQIDSLGEVRILSLLGWTAVALAAISLDSISFHVGG